MRRMIIVGLAAALAAGLMLLPAGASARGKHRSCTRSARVDRNHDRIPDRWECRHRLSLKVKQTRRDPDRDGLNNLGEFEAGDDPHRADSDHDGVRDGNEHAGTIQSFVADAGSPNTGTLTIGLAGGGTLTGRVTGDTECEAEHTTQTATATRESESGDDHQGESSNEPEGENNQNGDDNENENENEGEHACTAADLTQGRAVDEADLKATSAGAIFHEIELG